MSRAWLVAFDPSKLFQVVAILFDEIDDLADLVRRELSLLLGLLCIHCDRLRRAHDGKRVVFAFNHAELLLLPLKRLLFLRLLLDSPVNDALAEHLSQVLTNLVFLEYFDKLLQRQLARLERIAHSRLFAEFVRTDGLHDFPDKRGV